MKPRFRLLPVVIFSATLALTLKVGAIWHESELAISAATAEETKKPAASEKAPANPAKGAKGDKATQDSPKKDQATKKPGAPPKSGGVGDEFDPSSVTQAEFEVLQRLAKRRAEIDGLRNDLTLRENLLNATELRVNAKLDELKKLKAMIEGLLKKHDDEQEAKLRSLVKIYETMKPKNAARILERLEMDVLLDVVERMREAKSSPIFAAMDPAKAKAVTAKLAERRELPHPSVVGEGG